MRIPYVNLGNHWSDEKERLFEIFEDVMSSGSFVGGHFVEHFEKAVCDYTGVKNCVSLNSGTDALVCSMAALGIKPGDEVITPPNSFVASTASIVHLGAKPVFVDVLGDQSIDPIKVEEAITTKTKAIMPVHLTGRMASMDKIEKIASENNLLVIEDCAQSIGSTYDSKQSGTWGDVGCFSTHPLKNLNACGDGGFVITDDDVCAQKIRSMRNHGMEDRNIVKNFGYVSRLDALQAAILSYRLEGLDNVIERRRNNAKLYRKMLDVEKVVLPPEDPKYFDTFHTFVIQVDRRDDLISHLIKNGIQTAIHYPIPIHLQPAASELGYCEGSFPVAEAQAKRILTIPVNQFLTASQVEFVAEKINEFFEII